MEYKDKVRIAVAVVSLATVSVLFLRNYRRRQRRNCPQRPCYLHSDQKPQFAFKCVLADNSFSQFKHLTLQDSTNDNSHPYEREITALVENPAVEFGFSIDNVELKEMNDTCAWIETESQLKELADKLSKERVFSVDTEQHSFRSFLGFTALIQISTQKEDYLLDTITLHDAMAILRPVFADPSICKVFHGADNDVLWLQRDFHIYVVNLFDTAKACEVLSKPQKSLAYLLKTYCGVTTNKLLQLEDWRQRPLSAEMLQYARTDAYYLFYIASCLIAELKHQDNGKSSSPDEKFSCVLEACCRSNSTCLQLYTKEIEEFPGEAAVSSLFSRHLSVQESSVSCEIQDLVRRLCTWRDLMARIHDESLKYVLSDQAIVSLAENLPTSRTEIYDIVIQTNMDGDRNSNSPLTSVSPVVYSHFDEFCDLIQDKKRNIDDIFSQLLEKCLGPNGSCPLSIYNYSLLLNRDLRLSNRAVMKKNGTRKSGQVARKASRELFVKKFSCKSPVYHNCKIFANDGRLLCYCDQRKLEWYLRRNLAKLVDENPPAIMLLFEPKGRPEDEDNDFYIQSKKNICVSCGEGSHYLRYRIIPSCYRMHFPEHLKSHRSHDIVLLCVDCHEVAHAAAEKYKKEVALEFGIPLFVQKVVDGKEVSVVPESSSSGLHADVAGVSPLQLRTAAMALLRHGLVMPPQRREELTQTVAQYYGGREISREDLERALLVGMSPHGRRRYKKKRGLSSKHSIISENNLGNGGFNRSETADAEPNIMNRNEEEVFSGRVDDSCEAEPSNGRVNPKDEANGEPKNNSKVSLLGHGPHGKQVVEKILKEEGEDGILEFCQKWRQVFVDATNPRFLPGGWDVNHSGRRAFGEFSVYNPAKKASAALSNEPQK